MFIKQGCHAAGMRDIAESAGMAVSNIYNHFASKEDLFAGVLGRRAMQMEVQGLRGYAELGTFPHELEGLVALVRGLVQNNEVFVRLAVIDFTEFGGAHISGLTIDIAPVVEALFRPGYERDRAEGRVRDFDLLTVTRFVHLALFGYFAMVRLFGGPSELFRDEVVENREIAGLLEHGLFTSDASQASETRMETK